MLSLALGASKVYALGRNKEVLKYLTEYDNRVVALPNEQGQSTEDYLKHVKATIQTSADVVSKPHPHTLPFVSLSDFSFPPPSEQPVY